MLFVFLMVVTALALLPLLFGVNASTCDWKSDATGKGLVEARQKTDEPFGLSVKTGDGDITRELRAATEERLRAGGIANLVDNPVTRPRADVALEEAQLRWLPFWATARTRVRAVVTGAKRQPGPNGYDTTVIVEGSCMGLVSQGAWRKALVEHLADGVAKGILPKE